MRFLTATLALPALLALPTFAQDEPITESRALELALEALDAVQAAYPEESFAEAVDVEVVDRETLVATLRVELLPQFVAQFGEGELAAAQCEAQVAALSHALMARYSWSQRSIHLCLDNVANLGELLDEPELARAPALRALLVHEAVHARDEARHAFAERFAELGSTDRVQGLNAVVEGHAQHVARRVCAAHGWSDGFETFTRLIAAVPAGDPGEVEAMVHRVHAAMFSFAYYEGESFVAAVEAADGPQGLARAFAEPPDGPAVVARPEWFLDPSLRPPAAVDADRALDVFDARLAPEGRSAQRFALTMQQVRPILAGLPESVVERFERGLRSMDVGLLNDPAEPDAQVTVGLYEFASAGDALFGLALMKRLMRLRDVENREGPVRITRAEYTELAPDADGRRGFVSEKSVEGPFGEADVSVALVARGPALVELMVVGDPPAREVLAAHATAVLDGALAPPPAEGDAEVDEAPGDGGAFSGSRTAPGSTR